MHAPRVRRRHGTLRSIAAFVLVAACKDGPTAPQLGSLTVSTATIGGDLDTDGYRLIVGSEQKSVIGRQATVALGAFNPGTYVVSLDGVAPNCTAEPASITVQVVAGAAASAAFIVTCSLTGVQVTTRTSGVDLPSGYPVRSGDRTESVGPNSSVVMSRLSPGIHTVSLMVNDNCSVAGQGVATVSVSNRVLTPVTFDIACTRTAKGIVFVRDTSVSQPSPRSFSSVLVASLDGSSVVPLADGGGPAWSPDGKSIALSETTCDTYYYFACDGGLIIIDPETRKATVLDQGDNGFDPSWSPDGKELAFTQLTGNFSPLSLLIVAPLNGLPSVVLNPPGVNAIEPSWSPDGKRIVFSCSLRSPGPLVQDICVINRDGTGFVQLTSDLFDDRDAAWSPDGSRIAFTTSRFNSGSSAKAIASMATDGTGVTLLTGGFDPAWSPDGSKLVFAGEFGLFTVNADGSNRTRLTTGQHRDPDWRK